MRKRARRIVFIIATVLTISLPLTILVGLSIRAYYVYFPPPSPLVVTTNTQNSDIQEVAKPKKTIPIKYSFANSSHVFQTFNNCGPATLSMILGFYGTKVGQEELGRKMRPYQNAQGDNDDKSIFAHEFVTFVKDYGYEAIARPNGTIELLKKFIAADIPVVVRTWLHPNEDIGHFRLVRGYDDEKKILIQDDSYEGKNLSYSYDVFNAMWQPFNYGYILVYPAAKTDAVREILGEEYDEDYAWHGAFDRSLEEMQTDKTSGYPEFNAAVAQYYLGFYKGATLMFEDAEGKIPRRMLWYQIEPIIAYQKLGEESRVLELTERIFYQNNRGFSELYNIRGDMYRSLGEREKAKAEYEKAVFYNSNFSIPQDL